MLVKMNSTKNGGKSQYKFDATELACFNIPLLWYNLPSKDEDDFFDVVYNQKGSLLPHSLSEPIIET